MQSQLYILLDLECGVKGDQHGRLQLLVESQGRMLCLPSRIARIPRNLWSALQHKSILDISETLLSHGETSAAAKMIAYLGLMGSEML